MKMANVTSLLVFLFIISNRLFCLDLLTEMEIASQAKELEKKMDSFGAYENQQKDLELEARLLINSHEVILDCIKNENYLDLKTVYEKMKSNSIYQRPNKDQVEEYKRLIQDLIAKAKEQKILDKKTHARRNRLLKNCLLCGVSGLTSFALFYWGCITIQNAPEEQSNNLAKYAIDTAVIIGLPLTSILSIKCILLGFSHKYGEMLKKMDALIGLFEELSKIDTSA